MKIDSSTINMGSGRVYTSSTEITQATTRTELSTGNSYMQSSNFRMTYFEMSGCQTGNEKIPKQNASVTDNYGQDANHPLASDLYSKFGKTGNRIQPAKTSLAQLHNQLLKEIEAFMERIRNQLLGNGNLGTQSSSLLDLTTNSNQPGSFWTRQEYTSVSYQETEVTTFTSTGVVKTGDGRTIDFNVSMEMSRSFMECSESLQESTDYILTDPLVIHLSNAPDTIGDQTFLFDLDCDGKKEEISQLTSGSGFLALDANDNGIIDDGSELFGTKSGNGFKDLAAYDEDGNGWIDENDSVFQKLKVWTKDEKGNDSLTNLKDADIGAIYLGAAGTNFSHNDLETNETKAVVRQTGIFLYESSGNTGFVQQIDFATKKVNEVA
ncbi:MAG: hypothetical protein ACI4F4_11470 [Lachnospiraceae bacterium]